MDIATNTTVNYDVKNVSINNILLTKQQDKLIVMAPYQWKDSTGKVIRTGNNVYKETDLASLGTPTINILKALIPSNNGTGNCNILLKDTITAIKGYSGIENGKGKWFSESLTEAQLLAAISPLTKQNVIDMVTSFTTKIFA